MLIVSSFSPLSDSQHIYNYIHAGKSSQRFCWSRPLEVNKSNQIKNGEFILSFFNYVDFLHRRLGLGRDLGKVAELWMLLP